MQRSDNDRVYNTYTTFSARSLARAAMGVAFIAVCSVIAVPIGAVPVTLSLFALMIVALLLSPVETFLAVVTYIALGAMGLPLFSGGGSGLAVLTGPTGGFILAYPLMTGIISLFKLLYQKKLRSSSVKYTTFCFLVCIATLPVCYLCGTLQFMAYAHVDAKVALLTCVVPFILPDVAKAVLAVWLSTKINHHIKNLYTDTN